MCGILGIYDSSGVNKSRFIESLNKLYHRGPDNQGEKEINKKLFFGHTRLSIIDLDSLSNQPFLEDENYILIFNGEIFNYLEIKEDLKLEGCSFKTKSDTEVLLKAYITWGEKCVEKFNGMWAFAIYDKIKNQIFCSRDRYGIKPFYYFFEDGLFIFSSMIKPILSYLDKSIKPNHIMINEFLYRGYNSQFEKTWFENIFKLLPGYSLKYDFNSIIKIQYYQKVFKISKTSFGISKEKVKNLIENSIKLRLRSDVEIASTLTTGIDSSTIVSLISKNHKTKLKTFTAYSQAKKFSSNDKKDFNKKIDLNESKSINYFKDYNVNPNLIKTNFKTYVSDLETCVKFLESGHASPAIVPVFEIYKNVSKKGIKVLFEGQGADEIFGGYVTDLFIQKVLNELLKFKNLYQRNHELLRIYSFKYIILRSLNSLKSKNWLIYLKLKFTGNFISKDKKLYKSKKFKNQFDFHQSEILPNLLHYGDSLSMANSVEVRLPFLDYNLVDYVNRLPIDFKIQKEKGKYILREVAKEFVPKEISNSNVKIGFAVPIDTIIKESKEAKELLYSDLGNNFFNQKKLNALLGKYFKNNYENQLFIFKILTVKIWFKLFYNE